MSRKVNTTTAIKKTLFERLDDFCIRKHNLLLALILILSALFSFLLFNVKINMMGDDAEYIVYGYNFAEKFQYPGYRGPLYPILLSPIIAIAGINIPLIKIFSALFVILSVFFLYKALYKRLPALVVFGSLFLLSINSFFLSYSSHALSEPLFLLIQSLLLYFFCKYFVDKLEQAASKVQTALRFLLIGFLILLLTLTRSVGYAAIGIIAVYFLFVKQWKNALFSVVANGAVLILYSFIKKIIWTASGSAYELKTFFTRDMYNPDRGMEDFGGLVARFFENINTYLSKYTGMFLGLYNDAKPASVVLGVVLLIFLCAALYWGYKRNKTLFFLGLYTFGFCGANFLILHAYWQQERFMIVYFPLILILIIGAIYYTLQLRRNLQFILLLVFAFLFFRSTGQTLVRVQGNIPVLKKNLKGDVLYGITPDWQNYILMSQWAAKNVPASENIAVRKPGTSIIYGNRDFYGIYAVPSIPHDTVEHWSFNPTKQLLVVDISENVAEELSSNMLFVIAGNLKLNGKKAVLTGVYEIPADKLDAATEMLKQKNFAYTTDYKTHIEEVFVDPNNLAFSPDDLLERLKKNNVHYMLLASLRMQPEVENGKFINTLHRYAQLMLLKYPNLMERIQVIGETEPAVMYKVIY